MIRLLLILQLSTMVIADADAQPRAGSRLSAESNTCAICHGTADLWEGDQLRLYISEEHVAEDIHGKNGVNCHDCHGGDPHTLHVPTAHSMVVEPGDSKVEPFRFPFEQIQKACSRCHESQGHGLSVGVHGQAHAKIGSQQDIPFDCRACHGEKAHGMVSVRDPRSPVFAGKQVEQTCFNCHKEQSEGLVHGVHAKAGKNEDGSKRPLFCSECHSEKMHDILPVDDPNSPVFVAKQVKLCGDCHEEAMKEYDKSVHGCGLHQSGLLVVAVCSDCHDAHAIFPAKDERSTLHATNVAGTCSECHRFIEERLRHSVHGGGNGLGGKTEKPAPGGEIKRHPSCTDCHQGHDLPPPHSDAFRLQSADRCGNCHVDLLHSYDISMHGALTDLGYVPGAKCSDCHGAHDILSLDDPNCRVAPGENRLATCRECHPNAVPNFCSYLPHASYKDGFDRNPVLHGIYLSMELLIYSVFAFFGLHSILWFIRSLIHVLLHGRPQRLAPGKAAYVRFQGIHRLLHAVVAASFLGLALTGLPIRYSDQAWAQTLVYFLGGFGSTSLWHRICGVITILYFVTHLGWLAKRIWIRRKEEKTSWATLCFGPDSPVPNPRDAVDMFRMFRWFVGLGPKPVFERWTYWEKFDYWAVFWGVGIIGTSGLMLWFPNLFCRFLPGEALNVAKIVHSEEALLATSFIFAIHFFGTHFRPEKFPMDMAVLSGLVSEEEMQEERPEFLERMREAGQLKEIETTVGSRRELIGISLAGALALIVGLALLAGIVIAMLGQ